jgi:hypothetical protein
MLLGRDGQLYVVDPFNTYSSSSEALSPSSQKIREDNIKDLKEWRKTSLNTLRVFDQNHHQYSNLNVVQIAVINSEYRSVFCVLYAHLEESSISVLLLMSRECVQLKMDDSSK